MKNSIVIIIVAAVIVVVVGAGGFALGTRIGASRRGGFTATGRFGNGGRFPDGGANGFRGLGGPGGGQGGFRQGPNNTGFVSGKVLSKDKDSVTVALPQGGSKTVYLSGSTRFDVVNKGSAADISVGETVTAAGTVGSDGSITGRNVTIMR